MPRSAPRSVASTGSRRARLAECARRNLRAAPASRVGDRGLACAALKVSCAFATSLGSPEHAMVAEQLGYERVWLYDTPQQSPDVWRAPALAAGRTERIGLGPGVLV